MPYYEKISFGGIPSGSRMARAFSYYVVLSSAEARALFVLRDFAEPEFTPRSPDSYGCWPVTNGTASRAICPRQYRHHRHGGPVHDSSPQPDGRGRPSAYLANLR
jgi:hypothetical protein